MEPIRTLRSARRQHENTTITPQDEVFIHWKRIKAAMSSRYRKSQERELMKGIMEEAVCLAFFGGKHVLRESQSSAMMIANTDPEIKIPPTVASAYLRLHGRTDQQLNYVDIRLIQANDPVVYRSHLQDRLIAEESIRRSSIYACGSNQWWTRLCKNSSRQRTKTEGKLLRRRKERMKKTLYIRIPSFMDRHSRVSDASVTLQHLTDQLKVIAERFQQLQKLVDGNEENLRKKRENLNALIAEIEEEAVDEFRMQQRVQLLDKCFSLMQERRVPRL